MGVEQMRLRALSLSLRSSWYARLRRRSSGAGISDVIRTSTFFYLATHFGPTQMREYMP
jgi:hypothetical protein